MLKFVYDNAAQRGDLVRGSLNLETGLDLETAVMISLFTERRAADEELDDVQTLYKGGYWGDAIEATGVPFNLGSRLWLLRTKKATQNTINLAKIYIEESLQWLIDDGVASSIEVSTARGNKPVDLRFSVNILRSNKERWDTVWEMQLDEL